VNLRPHLDAYLELRRALGFKVGFEESALRGFVNFLKSQDSEGPMRAQMALDWACTASPRCGRAGQYARFRYARQFLAYLKAFLPDIEVPPAGILTDAPRPRPCLLSAAEIAQMLEATRALWMSGSLEQITLESLIGLLASTGLRIGEALRLTLRHVQLDQEPPRLEIRNTKFRKSRFVPIHPTTAARLRTYLEQRQRLLARPSSEVFLLEPGKPLHYSKARYCFQQITRHIGIVKTKGRRGPGLHSLRHTFAVDRLVSWYRAGQDVRSLLPNLAVYLGHLGLIQTYHYLTATPELLTAAAQIFEAHIEPGGNR